MADVVAEALQGAAERVAPAAALSGSLEPRLIAFSTHHNPVGTCEPGYSLLTSGLYAAALALLAVGQTQAVMLLNPALTAEYAGARFLLARPLGYGRVAGVTAARLFGPGTMAWPYSKSFMRVPAVALLWTLAFCGVAACARQARWWVAVLAVLAVALSLGIKITSGFALPVVVLTLAWALHRAGKPHWLGLLLIWLVGAVFLNLRC